MDIMTSQDGSTTNHAPEGIGIGPFRVPAAHRLLATKTIFTIELYIKDQTKRLGNHTKLLILIETPTREGANCYNSHQAIDRWGRRPLTRRKKKRVPPNNTVLHCASLQRQHSEFPFYRTISYTTQLEGEKTTHISPTFNPLSRDPLPSSPPPPNLKSLDTAQTLLPRRRCDGSAPRSSGSTSAPGRPEHSPGTTCAC